MDKSNLATLWEQFGEGSFLFQHDCPPVHKAKSIKVWLVDSGMRELDSPYRALTLILSNTFGMNQNGDCEPGPLVEHQCLTSQMFFRVNWQKIPTDTKQNLVESLPRGVEAVIAAKGELHFNAFIFRMGCH